MGRRAAKGNPDGRRGKPDIAAGPLAPPGEAASGEHSSTPAPCSPRSPHFQATGGTRQSRSTCFEATLTKSEATAMTRSPISPQNVSVLPFFEARVTGDSSTSGRRQARPAAARAGRGQDKAKSQPRRIGFLLCLGSSTWARTRDLRINSPALYRLSYRGSDGFGHMHSLNGMHITANFSGSSTWARTRDLRINSPALYRLSYRGTEARILVAMTGYVKTICALSSPAVKPGTGGEA